MPATAQRLASLQLPGVRLGPAPAEPVRRLPTGIGQLDALLGGGLPRGHLSEIVGGPSSGRTALLHALLAGATRRGEVVAVIYLPDALDPRLLARAGAGLDRVLWVQPPSPQIALKCAELILGAGGFGMLALDGLGARTARPLPRSVWPRLAHVTRRAGVACVVCAPRRLATTAAMALTLTPRRVHWNASARPASTSAPTQPGAVSPPGILAPNLLPRDRLGGARQTRRSALARVTASRRRASHASDVRGGEWGSCKPPTASRTTNRRYSAS